MDISELRSDRRAIEQGTWIEEIPEMGKLRLKVRGMNNADYQRMMQRLLGAVPRNKREGGRIDAVEMDRIIGSCLHATVLLDWDGLKVGDQPQPYDKELAFKLCTDPMFFRFRQAVGWAAAEVDASSAEEEREDAGN